MSERFEEYSPNPQLTIDNLAVRQFKSVCTILNEFHDRLSALEKPTSEVDYPSAPYSCCNMAFYTMDSLETHQSGRDHAPKPASDPMLQTEYGTSGGMYKGPEPQQAPAHQPTKEMFRAFRFQQQRLPINYGRETIGNVVATFEAKFNGTSAEVQLRLPNGDNIDLFKAEYRALVDLMLKQGSWERV